MVENSPNFTGLYQEVKDLLDSGYVLRRDEVLEISRRYGYTGKTLPDIKVSSARIRIKRGIERYQNPIKEIRYNRRRLFLSGILDPADTDLDEVKRDIDQFRRPSS